MTPMGALAVASAAGAGWVLTGTPRAAARRLDRGRRGSGPQSAGGLPPLRWLLSRRSTLVAGAALVAMATLGVAAASVAVVLSVVFSRRRVRSVRAQVQAREQDQAAVALQALTAELRAGRSPAEALAMAAEAAGPDTARVLRRAAAIDRLGGDVAAALVVGEERADEPTGSRSHPTGMPTASRAGTAAVQALRMLSAAWRVGIRGGAGLALPIEHAADELTAAGLGRRDLAAQLAGPRTTAALLAGLPALGLGLAALAGAAPVRFLLHTPVGIGCLAAGVALDIVGLAWTDAIVSSALRRGS